MAALWAAVLGIVWLGGLVTATSPGCVFPSQPEYNDNSKIPRLGPLLGKTYTIKNAEGFQYQFSLCKPVEDLGDPKYDNAGVVQWELQVDSPDKVKNPKSPFLLGKINNAHFMQGSNFLSLEYRGGDLYHSHCGQNDKRAHIMIQCKKGEKAGNAQIYEEQKNKTAECYYLFELEHEAACALQPSAGLSVGTVICIVFLCVAALYLLAGFLYQRFFVGAKGVEQMPNYHFWRDFGNLQADGCDLICRSGLKFNATGGVGSREYRGIGDDQIHHVEEESDHDDHLLPM